MTKREKLLLQNMLRLHVISTYFLIFLMAPKVMEFLLGLLLPEGERQDGKRKRNLFDW